MGLFDKMFRKKEQRYKILIPFFEEAFELLVNFANEQVDDNKYSDTIKIGTSFSAVVAASYFIKNVQISNGNIVNQSQAIEVADIINPFFDYVSGALVRVIERETGKKQNFENWADTLYKFQQNKLEKYIVAISKIVEKGRETSTVTDLSFAVTEDLFEEEIFDPIFDVELFTLVSRVKV